MTGLRLRKVVDLHYVYEHSPNSVFWLVLASHFALLSEIEYLIIIMCANLPALASLLQKRDDGRSAASRPWAGVGAGDSGSAGAAGSGRGRRRWGLGSGFTSSTATLSTLTTTGTRTTKSATAAAAVTAWPRSLWRQVRRWHHIHDGAANRGATAADEAAAAEPAAGRCQWHEKFAAVVPLKKLRPSATTAAVATTTTIMTTTTTLPTKATKTAATVTTMSVGETLTTDRLFSHPAPRSMRMDSGDGGDAGAAGAGGSGAGVGGGGSGGGSESLQNFVVTMPDAHPSAYSPSSKDGVNDDDDDDDGYGHDDTPSLYQRGRIVRSTKIEVEAGSDV